MFRGAVHWWATSVNGQLQRHCLNNGSWTVLPGPGGFDSFNNDRTCFADSPEFSQPEDKLAIIWSRACTCAG